jgi:Ca2+-binding RTX toxin-like protein
LLGSSSADVFTGNGSAILMGRSGNDIYYAKAGDSVREADGEGRDTVIARGSYELRPDAEVEVLKLSGVSSRTSADLTGSNTANEIVGHAGTNTLKGQGGNDVIKAASGNDRIYGGIGNDRIHGGAGNDKLKGETGRDTFVFDTTLSSAKNVDRIYDFNPVHDSFQLDNAAFANLGSGSTSRPEMFTPDMFVKGKAARDKEDRVIYDKDTGALYFDRDGTGSEAQVKIAILTKNLKLTHYDFSII